MQGITELVKEKAKELLSSGKVQRVLGWQKGEFMYDQTPQSFSKIEELDKEMIAHASQYSRLTELTKEKEEAQSLLDEKMERWMYLTELKEKIDTQ